MKVKKYEAEPWKQLIQERSYYIYYGFTEQEKSVELCLLYAVELISFGYNIDYLNMQNERTKAESTCVGQHKQ